MCQSGDALAMSTTISAMLTLRRSFTERQITSEETDWLELSSHASVSRLTRSENETFGFNGCPSKRTETNGFVTTEGRLSFYA